ncbi:MAG: DNA cytosine methyltransferase [Bacteroidales bacterium]|nr:DNA cytosine methyltransferase [Bacteroidales bacterium]MBR4327947.1 DNA cytosine methyltransferase [Bacteroidales bacterium]
MHNLPKHKKIKVFEGFAGYGGATFGLKRAGIDFDVIGFSENDKDAIELYQYNFPEVPNFGDITQIDPNDKDLPDFDLFTGGFPCQPFSTVGKRQGQEDERGRGTLFGDIIRICEVKKPKYILLENVKGLRTGKMKATFDIILDELHRIGYDTQYAVLNSKDYGIPQTRERLWIFAYLGELPINFNIVPPVEPLQGYLVDFLDKNPSPDLYKTQQQIARIHEIHSNDVFDVSEPLCYDIYNRKIRYDRICMTVTPPEHNVIRIVEPMQNGEERFRKLSLDEHFRLMGFRMDGIENEIKFPPTQNYTRLGRRAGNGWDVNLVGILLNHIFWQLL